MRNNYSRAILATLCVLALFSVSCIRRNTDSPEVEHNDYVAEMSKITSSLPPERKQQRQKWLSELQHNPVYHALVDSETVSVEYLPVLNAISDGIRHTYQEDGKTMFGISDDASAPVEQSSTGQEKMNFVIAITAMSIKENGGMPENIVAVFERYKKTFNLYGQSGNLIVFPDGKQAKVTQPYNLSFAFALFDPKDEKALDGIYEGVKKGISSWSDDAAVYTYPFMNSKTAYMGYLKEVYADSPYLLKVDFELTPDKLYAAYRDNEVAADEKYEGKKVAITGQIADIGKDIMNRPYVSFATGDLEHVTCYFPKSENSSIARLQKGHRLEVSGECRGLSLMNVVLEECKIVQ